MTWLYNNITIRCYLPMTFHIANIVLYVVKLCTTDIEFGTNKKNKQLFTLAFLDGNNNTFRGSRAFILNAKNGHSISCSKTVYQHFGVLQSPTVLVL